MKQFTISQKSSGFLLTVMEDGVPMPQPRGAEAHVPPAAPYPHRHKEAALSTFDDVVDYMREELGLGIRVSQCAPVAQSAVDGPSYDWEARDRRQSALNHAAVLLMKDGTPDDVLRAAAVYESYLRDGLPETSDAQPTKPSPEA